MQSQRRRAIFLPEFLARRPGTGSDKKGEHVDVQDLNLVDDDHYACVNNVLRQLDYIEAKLECQLEDILPTELRIDRTDAENLLQQVAEVNAAGGYVGEQRKQTLEREYRYQTLSYIDLETLLKLRNFIDDLNGDKFSASHLLRAAYLARQKHNATQSEEHRLLLRDVEHAEDLLRMSRRAEQARSPKHPNIPIARRKPGSRQSHGVMSMFVSRRKRKDSVTATLEKPTEGSLPDKAQKFAVLSSRYHQLMRQQAKLHVDMQQAVPAHNDPVEHSLFQDFLILCKREQVRQQFAEEVLKWWMKQRVADADLKMIKSLDAWEHVQGAAIQAYKDYLEMMGEVASDDED